MRQEEIIQKLCENNLETLELLSMIENKQMRDEWALTYVSNILHDVDEDLVVIFFDKFLSLKRMVSDICEKRKAAFNEAQDASIRIF